MYMVLFKMQTLFILLSYLIFNKKSYVLIFREKNVTTNILNENIIIVHFFLIFRQNLTTQILKINTE